MADSQTSFMVRYQGRTLPLRSGSYVLGRSASAQIVLDDALASRRHAQLVVQSSGVSVEDLGSINGVFVNGQRIQGRQELEVGDRVVIGKQELVLLSEGSPVSDAPGRMAAVTLAGLDMSKVAPDDSESTHQADVLELLGGVAEKVLRLGRGEEAEKILATRLANTLDRARAGKPPPSEEANRATALAVKLAVATKKGSWIDYAVELHTLMKRPLPGDVVDELFNVLRLVSPIDLPLLRAYVALLKTLSPSLGPAERFVAQRIEGLERQASAK